MAHSLSAKKRIRQNEKRRIRNRAHKSEVKTQIKSFVSTLRSGDVDTIEREYRTAQKKLDKLGATGVVHKNTISRQKAQLARKRNEALAKAN